MNVKKDVPPALLFDDIPGYPKGFRVMRCSTSSPARLSSILRLEIERSNGGLTQSLRGKPKHWQAEAANIEGPFGEFHGNYPGKPETAPVVTIERIYYRDDPIIMGSPPEKPPNDIIKRGMGSKNDPMSIADPSNAALASKAIIDACRPFDFLKEFPAVAESSKGPQEKTRAKWTHVP